MNRIQRVMFIGATIGVTLTAILASSACGNSSSKDYPIIPTDSGHIEAFDPTLIPTLAIPMVAPGPSETAESLDNVVAEPETNAIHGVTDPNQLPGSKPYDNNANSGATPRQNSGPTPENEQVIPEQSIDATVEAVQPTPAINTPTPKPTAEPIPVLGNLYQDRLVQAGYSNDIAKRIASLYDSKTNIKFADELIQIGRNAPYAQQRMIEVALPLLEDGISDDELAIVEDPDKDGKNNETEINEKSNIFDPFNKLPASIDSFVVLDNELYAVVAGNESLSYAFDLQNFKSAIKELEDSPYKDTLLTRLDEVSQAWNYKVRREDQVLFDILSLSPNDTKGWQFRWDNGSYHLDSWINYSKTGDINSIHILPLDNAGIEEWFNEKEDAEFAYMNGLWVPDSMFHYKIESNEGGWWTGWSGQPSFDILSNNMDVILGKKDVRLGKQQQERLSDYGNLRDRIVNGNQVNGTANWARQIYFEGFEDWEQVPIIYRTQFVPVLENNWEDFGLIEKAYGLAVYDMLDLEWVDTSVAQLYNKAIGAATYGQVARNPSGFGGHQVLAITVPQHIIPLLPEKKILYAGQSISPYSALEGAIADRPSRINQVNSTEIVWAPK